MGLLDGLIDSLPDAKGSAPSAKSSSGGGGEIESLLRNKAAEYDIDPDLFVSLAKRESGLRPDAKNTGSSAGGLFQFIDGTWNRYGNKKDKFDPEANADAAARMLRDHLGMFDGDYSKALAAHHVGAGKAATALTDRRVGDKDVSTQQWLSDIFTGAGRDNPMAKPRGAFSDAEAGIGGYDQIRRGQIAQAASDESPVSTSLKRGMKGLTHSAGLAIDNMLGDSESAAQRIIDKQAFDQATPAPSSVQKFGRDWDELAEDDYSGMFGTILKNPAGSFNMMLEQTPNSLPGMTFQTIAGVAGRGLMAFGPVGAAAGLALQSAAALAGNFLPEGGAFLEDELHKSGVDTNDVRAMTKWIEEHRGENFKGGATKAGVISAVDGVTGWMGMKMLAGPSVRFAKAEKDFFAKNGVNVADSAALQSARAGDAYKAAMQPFAADLVKATEGFGMLKRGVGATALDAIGEGVGEYAGSYAATGEASVKDAVLEGVMGIGQGAAMAGASYGMGKMSGPDQAMEELRKLAETNLKPAAQKPNSPLTNAAKTAQPKDALMDALAPITAKFASPDFLNTVRGNEHIFGTGVAGALDLYRAAINPSLYPAKRIEAIGKLTRIIDMIGSLPGRAAQSNLNQQALLADEEGSEYVGDDGVQQQYANQAELQQLITEEKQRQQAAIKDQWLDQHIARATQGPTPGFGNMVEYENFLREQLDQLSQLRAEAKVTNDQKKAQEAQQKERELADIAKRVEDSRSQESSNKRDDLLSRVLASNPQNPNRAFDRALRLEGFRDSTFTEAEKAKIARFGELRQMQEEGSVGTPNEGGDFGIKAKPEQAATQANQNVANMLNAGWQLQGKQLVSPKGEKYNLKAGELLFVRNKLQQKAKPTGNRVAPQFAQMDSQAQEANDAQAEQEPSAAPATEGLNTPAQQEYTPATEQSAPATEQSIEELQAQLAAAKFGERLELNDILIQRVIADIEQSLARGEMPAYDTGNGTFVAIHPSAQQEGMLQVTRYSERGVMGDSQYSNVRDAVRDNGLWFKRKLSQQEADTAVNNAIIAESDYQEQRREFERNNGKWPESRWFSTREKAKNYILSFGYGRERDGEFRRDNGPIAKIEEGAVGQGGFNVILSEFTGDVEDKLKRVSELSGKTLYQARVAYKQYLHRIEHGDNGAYKGDPVGAVAEANRLLDSTIQKYSEQANEGRQEQPVLQTQNAEPVSVPEQGQAVAQPAQVAENVPGTAQAPNVTEPAEKQRYAVGHNNTVIAVEPIHDVTYPEMPGRVFYTRQTEQGLFNVVDAKSGQAVFLGAASEDVAISNFPVRMQELGLDRVKERLESLPDIQAPKQEAAQQQEETDFEHAGYKIYRSRVNVAGEVKDYWAVQTKENRQKGKVGFGDTLHETKEQAIKAAERQQKDVEATAKYEADEQAKRDAEAKAKAEKEADTYNGFLDGKTPAKKGLIRKALAKEWRLNGVVVNVRDYIESGLANGDLRVSTYEENKIKPMSRTAFNRATQREQDAHEKKVREGGKVTVYEVNGFDLGKTAYDYAQHLLTKAKAETPAVNAVSQQKTNTVETAEQNQAPAITPENDAATKLRNGEINVLQFMEASGLTDDDVGTFASNGLRDQAEKEAKAASPYHAGIAKLSAAIYAASQGLNRGSTAQSRKEYDKNTAKYNNAQSTLGVIAKSYEHPFNNNLLSKLPDFLKQRYGKHWDSISYGEAAKRDYYKDSYSRWVELLIKKAEEKPTTVNAENEQKSEQPNEYETKQENLAVAEQYLKETERFYAMSGSGMRFGKMLRDALLSDSQSRLVGTFSVKSGKAITKTSLGKAKLLANKYGKPIAVVQILDDAGVPVAGVMVQVPFKDQLSSDDDFSNRKIIEEIGGVGEVVYPESNAKATANSESTVALNQQNSADSDFERGKAMMAAGLDKLITLLGGKTNMLPEEEAQIIPVMSQIFRGAALMGYAKFKEASRFVLDTLRSKSPEVADKIDIENLQAGYINAMKSIEGASTKAEIIEFDSVDQLYEERAQFQGRIAAAEQRTALNPTDAQKESGIYAKGKFAWKGMTISIETPKGAERSGTDESGQRWSITAPTSYGYFLSTTAADKEHLDVYIGDKPESDRVYVINQTKVDSLKLDEHKILIGFDSEEDAKNAYFGAFSEGFAPRVFGSIAGPFSVDEFKAMLPKLEKARFIEDRVTDKSERLVQEEKRKYEEAAAKAKAKEEERNRPKLDQITVTRSATLDGKEIEYDQKADEALNEIDGQMTLAKRLLECLAA